jgi:hypothetical protein
MPDGNRHGPAEGVEDAKAFWLGDVLEIDAAEGGCEEFDRANELIWVLGAEANRGRIEPPLFEEQRLSPSPANGFRRYRRVEDTPRR